MENTRRVTARLPSDTVYVYGTVNGKVYTWTNYHDDIWEARAVRDPNDIYEVVLTITNANGVSVQNSITVYYGLHLITDRTQEDVDYAKMLNSKWVAGKWTGTEEERALWEAGTKGVYTAADWNRVESAVQFVHQFLADLQSDLDALMAEKQVAPDEIFKVPYTVPKLTTKTDWKKEGIPRAQENGRYLSNVDRLTDIIPVTKNLPKSMARLDYRGANEIEKAIMLEYDAGKMLEYEKKDMVERTSKAFYYSDEIFCGEV